MGQGTFVGANVKRAVLAIDDSGGTSKNEVVADPGDGFVVVVYAALLSFNTKDMLVLFESNGVAVSGPLYADANGGFVLPFMELGWIRGSASNNLQLTTGAVGKIGGVLLYGVEQAAS